MGNRSAATGGGGGGGVGSTGTSRTAQANALTDVVQKLRNIQTLRPEEDFSWGARGGAILRDAIYKAETNRQRMILPYLRGLEGTFRDYERSAGVQWNLMRRRDEVIRLSVGVSRLENIANSLKRRRP